MITVADWLKEEKERLERFVNNYLERQLLNKDSFPDRLPIGEWDEQYRCFEDPETENAK